MLELKIIIISCSHKIFAASSSPVNDQINYCAPVTNMLQLEDNNENYYDAADCCGNGCANCVLLPKQQKSTVSQCFKGKRNILSQYRTYKLIEKKPHVPNLLDVAELHFACAEKPLSAAGDDYVLCIPPGHHVMMRVPLAKTTSQQKDENNIKYYLRPYSPFWLEPNALEFKLLVNLNPKGPMSLYIDNLVQGEASVQFRGPIGNFLHEPATAEHLKQLLIITQGVAIAPSMRIVEQVLANEEDYTRIWHFACFQDLQHLYFRQLLIDFNKYWNFSGRIYLSRQQCSSACCAGGKAQDDCQHFRKQLRYKEAMFLKRLDVLEIVQTCSVTSETHALKYVVILCGAREFQDRFAESLKECSLPIGAKNIVLL